MTGIIVMLFGIVGMLFVLAAWRGAFQRTHPDGPGGGAYLFLPTYVGVFLMGVGIWLHPFSWVPRWIAYTVATVGILCSASSTILWTVRPKRLVPDWEQEQRAKLERIAEETGVYPQPVGGFMMPETPEEAAQRRQEREELTAQGVEAELAAIEHAQRRREERRARRRARRRPRG